MNTKKGLKSLKHLLRTSLRNIDIFEDWLLIITHQTWMRKTSNPKGKNSKSDRRLSEAADPQHDSLF